MKNDKNNLIPKKIRILQNIIGFVVGLIALTLWGGGLSGYIAFLLAFTAIYVGIGFLYIKDNN